LPGYVAIELDKPRRLRFDINALADLEETMGATLPAIISGGVGIRALRALIWAGLRWEDPGLTEVRAGELLQVHLERGGDLAEISKAVHDALAASGLLRPGLVQEETSRPNPPPTAGRGASPSGSRRRRPSPTARSGSSPTSSGA